MAGRAFGRVLCGWFSGASPGVCCVSCSSVSCLILAVPSSSPCPSSLPHSQRHGAAQGNSGGWARRARCVRACGPLARGRPNPLHRDGRQEQNAALEHQHNHTSAHSNRQRGRHTAAQLTRSLRSGLRWNSCRLNRHLHSPLPHPPALPRPPPPLRCPPVTVRSRPWAWLAISTSSPHSVSTPRPLIPTFKSPSPS